MGMEEMRKRFMSDSSKYPPGLMVENDRKRKRYGEIDGYPVGSTFEKRSDLVNSGVHRNTEAGICGAPINGATSIVLSGKYEDDKDFGDRIIYTGTGGRSHTRTGDEIWKDQSMTHPQNMCLRSSVTSKHPVRVIRGSEGASVYAPYNGYRYDGLYDVTSAEEVRGKSGFNICQFVLVRRDGQPPIPVRRRGIENAKARMQDDAGPSWTKSLSLASVNTTHTSANKANIEDEATSPTKPGEMPRKFGLKRRKSENEFSDSPIAEISPLTSKKLKSSAVTASAAINISHPASGSAPPSEHL